VRVRGCNPSVSESELHFLHATVLDCIGKTVGRDCAWQLAPVFASIPYTRDSIAGLEALECVIEAQLPELSDHGKKRAVKAYVRTADTITKPSYIGRLTQGHVWSMRRDQRDTLADCFIREPLSGGLVFSIFHPRDLLERRRPGYVPCLVAGSFLVHRRQLHVNAFFRSQSVLEFGIQDLLFLRRFQIQFLKSLSVVPRHALPKRLGSHCQIAPGPLNLHFARVVIPSRLARNRKGYLRRCEVVERWMELAVHTVEHRVGRQQGAVLSRRSRLLHLEERFAGLR
jgi:hypothetical protein